jgi:hypothetical protein
MKQSLIIPLITISLNLSAQNKIIGNYRDNFRHHISINKDSTFKNQWIFDVYNYWAKGKWIIEKDTIYFNIIPVFDTLEYKNDSLILSIDEFPERMKTADSLKNTRIHDK